MIGEVYVLPMLQKSRGTVVWLVGYSHQELHHKSLSHIKTNFPRGT